VSPYLQRPGGTRLYHETHGDPNHPPLVLLEGMGGDIAGWRRNIPHLASRLFVVAHDFRGNDRSEMADEPVTMTTFVDDTVALLDALGLEAAHLYGQSFGGMVAQELALTHPGRVRSLVLGCTHPGHAHVVRSAERAPKDRPWELLYSPGFSEAHPEHVAEDLAAGSRQQPHARRRQWEAVQGWDAHERLPEIDAPTLVIHGAEDRMVHPENARMLAERIPGARLALIEGAGHVYHSERAEEADRLVLEFVERVEAEG
jgi:pimeloyl-ACP methyl ester carboxylesterase